MFSARAVSLSALAASAASPWTSASAVGPSSIGFSASAPALSAARSDSEFLTIRNLRVGVAQLGAQLGDLRDGDAAVVDGEDRVGAPGSGRRSRLRLLLFDLGSWFLSTTDNARTIGGRRGRSRIRLALEAPPAPDLRVAPPEVLGFVSVEVLTRVYAADRLLDDVARARRVDLDARAHRASRT